MSNFLKNTTDLEKILNETSDISVLLDNIQRRLEEIFLSVPQLISFTIDNVTYQAEKGMAWWNWCNSEYSQYKFHTGSLDGPIGDYVYNDNLIGVIYNESFMPVSDGELIVSGGNYTLQLNHDMPQD